MRAHPRGVTPLAATPDDEQAVLDYVVAAQADPTRHVVYVGSDHVSVAADLAAAARWRERTLVARDAADRVTGVLTVDLEEERGRVWWLGPWADDEDTHRRLLAGGDLVAGEAHDREFALDQRNRDLAALVVELGYRPEQASLVLVADLAAREEVPVAAHTASLDEGDRDVVAGLHDELFPNTHTPGDRLVRAADTSVLVARTDRAIGYVATQLQADGSLYVDYVGVAPDARGRGLGRQLVAVALQQARADGVDRAHLTVRADHARTIALYRSLGFVEERTIAPFRRGFATS